MGNSECSPELRELISELNTKLAGTNDEFVCVFNIDGECSVTLDMSASGDKLTPGAAANPDVQIDMSLKTLKNLLSGKLHPMVAYSTRKIKLKGDMTKAMKLASVLGQ